MQTQQSGFGTVVAGVDGSWFSDRAVEAAALEASRREVTLVLLAVARVVDVPAGLSLFAAAQDQAIERSRGCVLRAREGAIALVAGLEVQTVLAHGLEDPVLDDVAARAGLLALGVQGAGGQSAFSLGSHSAELLQRFRCPVLLPRRRATGAPVDAAAVVVGIDGRGPTRQLVGVAAGQARLRRRPLRVVHAVMGEPLVTLATLRAAGLPEDVEVTLEVTTEHPVEALVGRVGPDDLLVLGTRGGGRLAGLVQGSVCRSVLDQVACDVVVVPPPPAPPLSPLPAAPAVSAARAR